MNIPVFEKGSLTRLETPLDSLCLGDVLEIQGPPSSGKSQLLYRMLVACIIPNTCGSISLGGWDKVAILFDTDASFSLSRLKQLMTSHLESALKHTIDPDSIQMLVKQSLQNLHVFSPHSSAQLAATLLHLPSYHRTKLPNSEIGILAVDSMSAFYWPDRFTAEQLRPTTHRVNTTSNPLHHVVVALQRFHRSHKPMIVLTNWDLTPTKTANVNDSNTPTYRQHLVPPPAVFRNKDLDEFDFSSISLPLTYHIGLSIPPVPQLPAESSFADVCAQESSRASTSRKNQLLGVIHSATNSQTSQFTFGIEG